jgi:hypothetical protein
MLTRRAYVKSIGGMLAASRLEAFATEPDFGAYSDTEKEKFLLSAKIVSAENIGHGVTKPVKVQMELGGVTHAASIQIDR